MIKFFSIAFVMKAIVNTFTFARILYDKH